MKIFTTEIQCLLDGQDAPFTAIVDQRDHAAYEASDLFEDGRMVMRIRWLAWHALKRSGLTTAAWPEFHDKLCVQAQVISEPAEPDAEDEEGLDPSTEA